MSRELSPSDGGVVLTETQLHLLVGLRGRLGYAHVYSPIEARELRLLAGLGLVKIGRPSNPPTDTWDVQPYFGAKLLVAGRKAIAKALAPAPHATSGEEVMGSSVAESGGSPSATAKSDTRNHSGGGS